MHVCVRLPRQFPPQLPSQPQSQDQRQGYPEAELGLRGGHGYGLASFPVKSPRPVPTRQNYRDRIPELLGGAGCVLLRYLLSSLSISEIRSRHPTRLSVSVSPSTRHLSASVTRKARSLTRASLISDSDGSGGGAGFGSVPVPAPTPSRHCSCVQPRQSMAPCEFGRHILDSLQDVHVVRSGVIWASLRVERGALCRPGSGAT